MCCGSPANEPETAGNVKLLDLSVVGHSLADAVKSAGYESARKRKSRDDYLAVFLRHQQRIPLKYRSHQVKAVRRIFTADLVRSDLSLVQLAGKGK